MPDGRPPIGQPQIMSCHIGLHKHTRVHMRHCTAASLYFYERPQAGDCQRQVQTHGKIVTPPHHNPSEKPGNRERTVRTRSLATRMTDPDLTFACTIRRLRSDNLPLKLINPNTPFVGRKVCAPTCANGTAANMFPIMHLNPNKAKGQLPWFLRLPTEDNQSDE